MLLVSSLCAVLASGCAVGFPKPVTNAGLTGVTLNGDVYSDLEGNTEYWWRYGTTTAYGSETPRRTIAIGDADPHPVSEFLEDLTPNTTYHFQFCVKDAQERPERICSRDQTFVTRPVSGERIAFHSSRTGVVNDEIYSMNPDGSNQTRLTYLGGSQPDWSPDAEEIVFSSSRDGDSDLYVMDADGSNQTRLTNDPSNEYDPAWSPDGSRIAFTTDRHVNGDGNSEIYVMDADGSDQTRLTEIEVNDFQPAWSPDGTRIAFATLRLGANQIYVMDADGSDQTALTAFPDSGTSPAWSPDGTEIAFGHFDESQIFVMDADGANPTNVSNNSAFNLFPAWKPDGSKIAFTRHVSGNDWDIHVMDPDGSDQTNLTNQPDVSEFEADWSVVPPAPPT
jgi:Tol biopolymer transport system component